MPSSKTSLHDQQQMIGQRENATKVLRSWEASSWYAMQNFESIPQTRLRFQKQLIDPAPTDAHPPTQYPRRASPSYLQDEISTDEENTSAAIADEAQGGHHKSKYRRDPGNYTYDRYGEGTVQKRDEWQDELASDARDEEELRRLRARKSAAAAASASAGASGGGTGSGAAGTATARSKKKGKSRNAAGAV